MIKINSSKIDKEILKNEIDNIIKNYKKNPKSREELNIENFNNHKDNIYMLEDFTKYHDIEFIKNIYRIVLQREVDEEALNQRLGLLRTGKNTKTEILATIRFSKEGRRVNIPILGIKKRYIMTLLYRIPIIRFFTKILLLPKLIERLNRFEAHYFIYQDELNRKIDTKVENIEYIDNMNQTSKKFQDIQKQIDQKVQDIQNETTLDIKDLKLRIRDIKRAKESLMEIERNLINLIEEIKLNQNNPIVLKTIKNEQEHFLDSLYISFEDKFRGSRDEIKKRQSYYLPFVESVLKNIDGLVIDIGCGRGEWLELLKNNSIKAKGIDLNRLMVKESQEYDLDAIFDDAINYLKKQQDNSMAVITGFHIVEHLPFEILISLFDESYRVLKSGGIIIFETPNPENIMVGSCNFYTDPTHVNPIPPVTLEFLAQNRGFESVKVHRLHPIKNPSFVDIKNSQDINNLIFASTKAQDYSVIGYKI